jgi:hypothetical protein
MKREAMQLHVKLSELVTDLRAACESLSCEACASTDDVGALLVAAANQDGHDVFSTFELCQSCRVRAAGAVLQVLETTVAGIRGKP